MSNWVKNILEISGKPNTVKKVVDFLKGADNEGTETCFDFNKVVPMPDSLKLESGSRSKLSLLVFKYKTFGQEADNLNRYRFANESDLDLSLDEYVARMLQEKQADLDLGRKVYTNLQEYGFADWYDWRVKKWGTKWNACDAACEQEDYDRFCFEFDTPWSAPVPVIEKLAQRFPAVRFHHIWTDENLGCNTGENIYRGNLIKENRHEDCSSEAYRIYLRCWKEADCIAKDQYGRYYLKDCKDCKKCG